MSADEVDGYFARLFGLVEGLRATGFCSPHDCDMLLMAHDGPSLLARLRTYVAPVFERPWVRF